MTLARNLGAVVLAAAWLLSVPQGTFSQANAQPHRRRRVLPIGRRLFQTKSSMRRQPSWNGLPA